MEPTSVRYMVTDLDDAVVFYRDLLDFEVELRPGPAFAMLYRNDFRLLLSVPGGGVGGGAAMADGTIPEPGGWNRFTIKVADLEASIARLREKGARFRSDVITGVGVKQALLEDPDGNLIELYEPQAAYHERPIAC
jgi:catechol 2,3-dioxygenase-like lactoylglutathione lyase family enzyme